MSDHHEHPYTGRLHEPDPDGWFDKPGNVKLIIYALGVICLGFTVADFGYHKHVHYGFEEIPGFHSFYGFVSCVALVLAASALRKVLMRDEDYYDPEQPDASWEDPDDHHDGHGHHGGHGHA